MNGFNEEKKWKNENSEKKNNITLSPMKYNLKRRIDKTYLKYNSPQKTKNNEKILIITPKNNIFQLSDNSKKIKKEIYELKKQIGYKEPIIANLTNINKPNEFYYNSIKIEEEKNNNDTIINRPIINLNNNNYYNLEPEKIYNFSLTNRSLIEKGIFKNSFKKKNDYLKNFNFSENKNVNSEFVKKNNRIGKNEFFNYMNEMEGLKKRKLNQWKKEFFEDNFKY